METYNKSVLKVVIAQICQTIGWHGVQTTALEIMIDVLHRYLLEMAKTAHNYAEQFGMTTPNLDHIGLMFRDMQVMLPELEEFVQWVEPVSCPISVPKLPIPKQSVLNFLKPGSREVVTRPVHIHEHLPPMYPEMEEGEEKAIVSGITDANTVQNCTPSSPEPDNSESVFKRPGGPISDNLINKRPKMAIGEEGRPTREIHSVMMTSSGFLSPAREGKLPEARTPQVIVDSPMQNSQYPAVPPELHVEKKPKMLNVKKKEPGVNKELFKQEKLFAPSKKIKMLNAKDKNKVLKSGGVRMPLLNKSGLLGVDHSNISLTKVAVEKFSKQPKPIKVDITTPCIVENTVVEKLLNEPNKLNIFKKVPKVKEEKSQPIVKPKTEAIDYSSMVTRESHSSEITITPINFECPKKDVLEKRKSPDIIVREEVLPKTETTITKSPYFVKNDLTICVDISSPGTPLTPKTPEIPAHVLSGKTDKEKKKRKIKQKTKEHKIKSPKQNRPKTPSDPIMPVKSEPVNPNVFPSFFPQFPSAPGLIPSPMNNPLLQRLKLNHTFGQTSVPLLPMMPNLPAPVKTETSIEVMPVVEKPPQTPTIQTPIKVEDIKQEPSAVVFESREPSEKKKEHKKEKKDKLKDKKKKEKKDKIKNKDKSEKKREKEEKKEKNKLKSKKEKKLKNKEKKEREAETSVPKLTLKLGLQPSRTPTPDSQTSRKITIKPVMKKREDSVEPVAVVPEREPSPELARISALVTRPPKPPKTPTIPSTSLISSSNPISDSSVPKLKKSLMKPLPKIKNKIKKSDEIESPDSTSFSSVSLPPEQPPVAPDAYYFDKYGNKVWICPACSGQDDGTPMIGCDDCDAWYHWVCVGIQVPPDDAEDWYCRVCIVKKQEIYTDKKKKRKKKDKKDHQ